MSLAGESRVGGTCLEACISRNNTVCSCGDSCLIRRNWVRISSGVGLDVEVVVVVGVEVVVGDGVVVVVDGVDDGSGVNSPSRLIGATLVWVGNPPWGIASYVPIWIRHDVSSEGNCGGWGRFRIGLVVVVDKEDLVDCFVVVVDKVLVDLCVDLDGLLIFWI